MLTDKLDDTTNTTTATIDAKKPSKKLGDTIAVFFQSAGDDIQDFFGDLGDKIEDKIEDIDLNNFRTNVKKFIAPLVGTFAHIITETLEDQIIKIINNNNSLTDKQKELFTSATLVVIQQGEELVPDSLQKFLTNHGIDLEESPELKEIAAKIIEDLKDGKIDHPENFITLAKESTEAGVDNTDASAKFKAAVVTAIDGKPADLIVEASSIVTDGASDKILTTEDVEGVLRGNTGDMLDIAEKVASEITDGKSDILFGVLTGDLASGATTTAEEVADTPLVGETA